MNTEEISSFSSTLSTHNENYIFTSVHSGKNPG